MAFVALSIPGLKGQSKLLYAQVLLICSGTVIKFTGIMLLINSTEKVFLQQQTKRISPGI
jgi:hypothetical protein